MGYHSLAHQQACIGPLDYNHLEVPHSFLYVLFNNRLYKRVKMEEFKTNWVNVDFQHFK